MDKEKIIGRIATGVSAALFLIYMLKIAGYMVFPSYLDHIQPMIAGLSFLVVKGYPLYPDWMNGDVYGFPYGPLLFYTTGIFYNLSPSVWMSKLPGVLALLATFLVLFQILKRISKDKLTPTILIICLIFILSSFDTIPYWNRAEPFLVFFAIVAFACTRCAPPLIAASLIAALAGIACGFKLHGFVYIAPSALGFLAHQANTRKIATHTLVMAGVFAIVIALPFLLAPHTLFDGYLRLLQLESVKTVSTAMLLNAAKFDLQLLVPLGVTCFWIRPRLDRFTQWFIIGLVISILLISVVGSLPGAGTHHLLPFVPLSLVALALMLSAPTSPRHSRFGTGSLLALIAVSLFFSNGANVTRIPKRTLQLLDRTAIETAKAREMEKLIETYPDAQIGYSDANHYGDTFYRIYSMFKGIAPKIDPAMVMDYEYCGVDPSFINRFVEHCAVKTWILPHGDPFALTNYYNGTPLASQAFLNSFLDRYRKVSTGPTYDVWTCENRD